MHYHATVYTQDANERDSIDIIQQFRVDILTRWDIIKTKTKLRITTILLMSLILIHIVVLSKWDFYRNIK